MVFLVFESSALRVIDHVGFHFVRRRDIGKDSEVPGSGLHRPRPAARRAFGEGSPPVTRAAALQSNERLILDEIGSVREEGYAFSSLLFHRLF